MTLRRAFEFMTMMPEDIRDKCEDLLNDIMTNQKKKMQEFSDWWKEDPTAQRLYQQSARQAKAHGERLRRKEKTKFVDEELEITQEEWDRLGREAMLQSRCIIMPRKKPYQPMNEE